MDDEYERAEKVFGRDMRTAEKLAALLNPETLFAQPKQLARVIDTRKRYDIETEKLPALFRQQQFRCRDRVTFDPDPEGRWHISGYGETPNEAMADLLEQLGAEVAKGDM